MEGGKRGGAEDENSIRKIGKNERKVRMVYDLGRIENAKNEKIEIRDELNIKSKAKNY